MSVLEKTETSILIVLQENHKITDGFNYTKSNCYIRFSDIPNQQ